MTEIQTPKKVTWKLPVLVIFLLLIALAFISLLNNSDDETALNLPEGSAILQFSGRIVEPPEGFEFVSEFVDEANESRSYLFESRQSDDPANPPLQVIVVERTKTIDEQIADIAENAEVEIENTQELAEFIAERNGVRLDISNYTHEISDETNTIIINESYDTKISDEVTRFVARTIILDSISGVWTEVEVSSTSSVDRESLTEFVEKLK